MHGTAQLESIENEEPITKPPLSSDQLIDPMLLTVNTTKKPAVVNMESVEGISPIQLLMAGQE